MRVATLIVGGSLLAACAATAGDAPPLPATPPDVYVVATSHLDTQWRWTVQDTIDDFLPDTMRGNFALIDKYPGYNFSFEGAFHYMLMKEYYPADFERLKGYVKAGRWKVAGSWVDAVDTNIPSPESLIRQTLYGNGFFRRELGVTSRDVFLPDCFGFGFALPAVAAHCGLVAFSTQKLTWGSSIKIPFDVGLWEGVDGSTLIAALNPGDYASEIKGDLTLDADLYATADRQVALTGLPLAFRYFGTGDVGVPPMESSVAWLQQSLAGPGPARVHSAAPDQMALDLMASHGGRAPEGLQRYRGEFLLTRHGTGCYTSQAAMKRFNRKNERLRRRRRESGRRGLVARRDRVPARRGWTTPGCACSGTSSTTTSPAPRSPGRTCSRGTTRRSPATSSPTCSRRGSARWRPRSTRAATAPRSSSSTRSPSRARTWSRPTCASPAAPRARCA